MVDLSRDGRYKSTMQRRCEINMTVTGFDIIVSFFDDNHQCCGALIRDLLIR